LRQKELEFKASLDYIVSPCLKTKTKTNHKKQKINTKKHLVAECAFSVLSLGQGLEKGSMGLVLTEPDLRGTK
jgi:hypothetical protein